jgi:hypothetical protein
MQRKDCVKEKIVSTRRLRPYPDSCCESPYPMRHLSIARHKGMRPGGYGILLAKNLVDEFL